MSADSPSLPVAPVALATPATPEVTLIAPVAPVAPAEPAGPAVPVVDGIAVIRREIRTLPNLPGVYRMLAGDGMLLYVGKAKSLRKRVANYANPHGLSTRIRRMVAETASLEIVTTRTEVEALLLEANLIKRLKPRYNVVLRDDKSFPYILITGDHPWPRITKHRGARSIAGEYFGPFASAGAVNQTLAALERAFPLRSCGDAEFAARTRPCLQFQIKRCTAPCVGRIAAPAYGAIVAEARDFLSGRSQQIQQQLALRMSEAAAAQDYEAAAIYRDRLRAMAHIHSHQDINVLGVGEADVIALVEVGGQTCIEVFFFRAGQNFGNRAYFPAHAGETEPGEVLAAFVGQFYDARPAPAQVLLSHAVGNPALLGQALALGAGRKVTVSAPERGMKRALVDHALYNAREALARRQAEQSAQARLLDGVAELFALPARPQRIEVYDNSHIQGQAPIGSMIVAGPEGFIKGAYRKFNIRDGAIAPGDDYAMMREVLSRRFGRLAKAAEAGHPPDRIAGQWPDLVLIDGGKGQLTVALEVFAALGITGVALAAIAKGPDRNAGREQFFRPGSSPFMLEPHHPVLYFLQRLRDEAHRFAIGTHRARRAKGLVRSSLDEVQGIGPKRKQALLHHFGSARDVAAAGLADLMAIPGINRAVAQVIYDHFHGD